MLSPADRALCDRDPTLPGLRLVLDDDAFLRLLRTCYPALEFSGARGVYVRYKKGTSCLVGFETTHRLGTLLVYARAGGAGQGDKLAARHRGGSEAAAAPASTMVAESGIAIHPFPHDQELSGVRRLDGNGEQVRFLGRLLPAGTDAGAARLTPLRYKPERRFVARVDAPGAPPVVLRCYTDEGYQAVLGCTHALQSVAADLMPSPIATRDRRRAISWPWIDGAPLSEVLRNEPGAEEPLAAAGRVLAALHLRPTPVGLGPIPVAAAVATAVQGLRAILPECDGALDRVAQTVAGFESENPMPPGIAHGDFAPDQVIVRGASRVSLLDFDRTGVADRHFDLGLFAARIRIEQTGRDGRRGAADAIGALTRGYTAAGGRIDPERLAVYTAIGLLLRAVEPFRRRDPDWAAAGAATIGLAEEELARARAMA